MAGTRQEPGGVGSTRHGNRRASRQRRGGGLGRLCRKLPDRGQTGALREAAPRRCDRYRAGGPGVSALDRGGPQGAPGAIFPPRRRLQCAAGGAAARGALRRALRTVPRSDAGPAAPALPRASDSGLGRNLATARRAGLAGRGAERRRTERSRVLLRPQRQSRRGDRLVFSGKEDRSAHPPPAPGHRRRRRRAPRLTCPSERLEVLALYYAFAGIGARIQKGVVMRSLASVVHSDPEILGGTPVFQGTRVPLRNLIDYLERGHSLDEFLDAFPSVSREQTVAALEAAHEALSSYARSPR